MATKIRSSVSSLFVVYHSLRVIAEAGRYFDCSTPVLAVNVISKRCKGNSSSEVCLVMYIQTSVITMNLNIQRYTIITLMMVFMDLSDTNTAKPNYSYGLTVFSH